MITYVATQYTVVCSMYSDLKTFSLILYVKHMSGSAVLPVKVIFINQVYNSLYNMMDMQAMGATIIYSNSLILNESKINQTQY